MKRTILSIAALLAGAAALAGCGGGSSAGTTTVSTTTARAEASGNFLASVHGFEARLQTSVKALQSGHLAKAASGARLLTTCSSFVGSISDRATTPKQRLAVTHLRMACTNASKAANAGMARSMTKAKKFAREALKQAQIAARLSG